MHNEDKPEVQLGLGPRPSDPGFLTLSLHPGAVPAWENVYGSFDATNGWRRGTFEGLKPWDLPFAPESPPRPNLRRFDLVTVAHEGYLPREGHALEVFDAVDENGNNYIALMLEYCNPDSNCVSYMGKKQVNDGKRCGLTAKERRRLGISLTFEEVERGKQRSYPVALASSSQHRSSFVSY
ncbi:hypothetical protein B0H10DRAFT_2435250 [Mycena sp. CBHHK59/15]|nr:hypothetical protein B0H10DRAFT_2435250 [Mycena sp. CBHHK59/15]